ncbi:AMP-binding protein [Micromonospora sp. CPCC 206060]|uniref:AMP-binding protein n=1 Tax=Micromonospora sp. CPCC 206060 TaxID=3122406 RepID=UPI002FF2FBAF
MPDHVSSPPLQNVLNTISLNRCEDTRHRIFFRQDGQISSLTLAEFDRQATNLAQHLHAFGVRPRDRVGVMSGNRIEWMLIDIAVLKLGGVTVGLEPNRFEPAELVDKYSLAFLFVEGAAQRGAVYDITAVRAWTEHGPAGAAELPLHAGYDPADICAIKQTSGSTGVPKGIEATVASINSSLTEVQRMFDHRDGDRLLVFIPVFFLQQRYWTYSALTNGHDVILADLDHVLDMAQALSPTVVMGVPGFYEQLKSRLEATALPVDADGRRDAIQAQLGGAVRYLWTGSAAASRAVLEFFNDGGVPLYEGYGLNETCIVSKNHPGAFRIGSVGRVLPNKRIRFDRDGVLIVGSREPVNCRYTWCAPGANERTYLPTGEVKTYDIGYVDEDGFLYVQGRVDDMVTLSTGYNVLLTLVEERIREHSDVHDCVLYGNARPFLTAVISPASPDLDARSLGQHLGKLNVELRNEQRIHALVVADEQFSPDNGLLNAQFKPMRGDIYRRYAAELDRIYQQIDGYRVDPQAANPFVMNAGKAAGQ